MTMPALSSYRPSPLEEQPRLPARGGSTRIRRFNGLSRRTHDWDGLRKDSQLWFEDGDCFVHFYGYGTSQRGPSLRIPFKDVEKLDCTPLTTEFLRVRNHNKVRRSQSEASPPQYDLYIPSPRDISRDEAFAFHLSTRNFFAYAVGREVVGERLSVALEGVWQRLRAWAPKAATPAELIAYLDAQGYSNFAENPEHALACLKFAESARIREVWINAFVHCAGMHERLFLSPEFPGLSNTTNALITRASLEMDLHIGRVVRAVGSFLEEELGTEHLGLSKPARDHLDYFRSFLHSFYVDKLGYFPPRATNRWDKRPWRAMYHDFQHLYDYLVDTESTCDMTSAKALTGGICVIQNLQAFDQRHGYDSLPHPLPLLPRQEASQRRKSSQRGLRTLALVSGMTSLPERAPARGLGMATNCLDDDVMLCQLVQEYQRFERRKLVQKLDPLEARKIRWILIYSALQMLTSIMKAAPEVKGVENTSYPLCALVAGSPPWVTNEKVRSTEFLGLTASTPTLVPDAMDVLEGRTSRISIHPDCEADNAEDFFASISGPRMEPNPSAIIHPVSRRLSQLGRTASLRSSFSSVQALHRSVVGSLSRRSSIRKEDLQSRLRKTQSHIEIVIENFDETFDGDSDQPHELMESPTTDKFEVQMSTIVSSALREQTKSSTFELYEEQGTTLVDIVESSTIEEQEEQMSTLVNSALQEFDFGLGGATEEPVLQSQQLEYNDFGYLTEPGIITAALSNDSDTSARDSYHSSGSGYPHSSNRSSTQDLDGPDTDLSSCENSGGASESDSSIPTTPVDALRRWDSAVSLPARYRKPWQKKTRVVSVNVGCYVPSGMIMETVPLPIAKILHERLLSTSSAKSAASSFYPDESVQAADIAEE